jgi:hypothetical protein
MPFGLTGAPSMFGNMTATKLGNLVGSLFELFVNDGGMGADNFDHLLADLRVLFTQCRECKLTLSGANLQFFVTEATFAGGRVGPHGIKPDLTKLTAVIDWEKPQDLQNLGVFLGLTGYFCNLIKGYTKIAQPLTDLVKAAEIPHKRGKGVYCSAMCHHTLERSWGAKEQHTLLSLKIALTQEPILKGPKFDSTPFIVTMDGSKVGFAGMVSQWHTTEVDGKTT